MRRLTPLIRLLAHDFVNRHHMSYDEALDSIYRSELLKMIQDPDTTFSTWAPLDLLDFYDRTELRDAAVSDG
ncbi:MAG: hypothetical protein LBL86_00050 [Coriobacteriales bacterium]|jgi:hypothetical protein|nr:hypothetical protein [Coriobacteriales bacterium]